MLPYPKLWESSTDGAVVKGGALGVLADHG
jgi:hypothetical protein